MATRCYLRSFLVTSGVVLVFLIGCADLGSKKLALPPDNRDQVTIAQGVWGNVWFWEGNFMPPNGSGTIIPVQREVYIYEATRIDSAVWAFGPFYRTILTNFVTKTSSNATGFFQATLPPGKYSLFVREDTLFYASTGDGLGYMQPATILPNAVTRVQIDITYKAAF